MPVKDEHEQLNEDSLELVKAFELQSKIKSTVYATVETTPVNANSTDDAADDPAIWYNATNPGKSLVFGSNKKGGLVSTNLMGNQIHYYQLGSINNVDIIYGFHLNNKTFDLLGCSNRTTQAINLFEILPNGDLRQYSDTSYIMDSTKIDDIYGFCFGRDHKSGEPYVFINGKNGLLQQFAIETSESQIKLRNVREVQFDSQTEGMVVDNARGTLYVGEEDKGVWMLDVNPTSTSKTFINESGESNESITYDIEGVTILEIQNQSYLIVSSQGNFSYAVFDINKDHEYLGSFKIAENEYMDGVEETDGIAIISDSLSVEFPNGIFVCQDGFNYNNDTIAPQNFKYVNTDEILSVIHSF